MRSKLRPDRLDPFQEFFVHFVRQGILSPMSGIEIHDSRVWAQLSMHLLSECSDAHYVFNVAPKKVGFVIKYFAFGISVTESAGEGPCNKAVL